MALHVWHAQTFQLDACAFLCAFGDLHILQTIERENIHFGAKSGLRDIDGNRAVQVVVFAVEDRVLGYFEKT